MTTNNIKCEKCENNAAFVVNRKESHNFACGDHVTELRGEFDTVYNLSDGSVKFHPRQGPFRKDKEAT